jgi:hypothetical protein
MGKVRLNKVTGCWLWKGSQNTKGYGWFHIGQQKLRAHRVSFAMFRRALEAGETIDHVWERCKERHCVNPDHLVPMSHEENCTGGRERRWAKERENGDDTHYDGIPI